jgi:hypothetical protein
VCNLANKCVEGNIALLAGSARRAVVVVEPAACEPAVRSGQCAQYEIYRISAAALGLICQMNIHSNSQIPEF